MSRPIDPRYQPAMNVAVTDLDRKFNRDAKGTAIALLMFDLSADTPVVSWVANVPADLVSSALLADMKATVAEMPTAGEA